MGNRNSDGLKASFHTLGCKLNFSETSTIGKMLAERGFSRASEGERPDIIVVNTCSVTEMADKKGRQLVRRLSREWPDATLVVTGCYAQLKPGEVADIEGVDIVLGSNEKLLINQFLDHWMETRRQQVAVTPPLQITEFRPSCERGDRTRYFLKVQDGCDYFCTYCTIPYARGRSRSGTIAQITDIARGVAAEGGREIVITGVNIGDFGHSTGETFLDLIRALDRVEGIERYRISSIEPNLLSDDIISFCASSRAFMPHFHLPLQSGSDDVLRLMHRHYDTALFARRVERIRELMPDAFIGVDVIVGTRGETEAFFEDSYRFIESLGISQLHVFSYSERPGTKALNIPYAVPPAEKHERSQQLLELSRRKHEAFYERYIGAVRPVLWEHGKGEGLLRGFTDNYIRVEQAPGLAVADNSITPVSLAAMAQAAGEDEPCLLGTGI